MLKMKTLIVIIVDESGSMESKKSHIIGGLNGFIRDQKLIENDEARLYLVKFNSNVNVVHRGIPLEEVPELTSDNYKPGGKTALYDAIAEGVRIADEDKTEEQRVVCVVMTDGRENASRETTKEQVKDIISGNEAKGDWTFLYIGENPEQWTRDAGMSACNAIQFNHNEPQLSTQSMSRAYSSLRSCNELQGNHLFSQ